MFSRRSASGGDLEGRLCGDVLDEVGKRGVVLLAHRLLQRDRLLGQAHARRAPRAPAHSSSAAISSLVGSRPSRWISMRSAWISLFSRSTMCTGMRIVRPLSAIARADGLADPPGGVGGELVAAAVVELLHRADQPERALLDQIQERQAAPDVALGDRHDQAQVGLDHVLLGGDVAALDALGQRDLLLGAQQRHAADRAQVQPQRVEARLDRQVDVGLACRSSIGPRARRCRFLVCLLARRSPTHCAAGDRRRRAAACARLHRRARRGSAPGLLGIEDLDRRAPRGS